MCLAAGEPAPSPRTVLRAASAPERLGGFFLGRTFPKAERKEQTGYFVSKVWKSGLIPLELPHIEMLMSSLSPPAFRE